MSQQPTTSNEDEEQVERIRYYHAKYVSYSRAVGVMWAVLAACHLIVSIVCLVQPSWLETENDASNTAYFGLWKYAVADPIGGVMNERGGFLDFKNMASDKFNTIAMLIGIGCLISGVSILILGLSFCLSSNIIFMAGGWLMAADGLVMGIACVLFPTSWSSPTIASVCKSSNFDTGQCEIGKSYMLAAITAVDGVVLSVLAFILAYRQVTLLPWKAEEDEEAENPNDANPVKKA